MSFLRHYFLKKPKTDKPFVEFLFKTTGFRPKNLAIYKKAFTHRSVNCIDEKGNRVSYERLEFLGDAVLGLVVASHLFNKVPEGDEGYLTKMRAKVVSRKHLNEIGESLGLIQYIESSIHPNQYSKNFHGNLFESLIGAVLKDRGFADCSQFIHNKIISPYVDIEELENEVISYKSQLIEWCQKERKTYRFKFCEEGKTNQFKGFKVQLFIDDQVICSASAASKKKAEEKASKKTYDLLQNKAERPLIVRDFAPA